MVLIALKIKELEIETEAEGLGLLPELEEELGRDDVYFVQVFDGGRRSSGCTIGSFSSFHEKVEWSKKRLDVSVGMGRQQQTEISPGVSMVGPSQLC